MVSLFSDKYFCPLFIVDDEEIKEMIFSIYEKRFSEVKICFMTSRQFLEAWANDENVLYQHDIIISLCPTVPELKEIGDLVQVWNGLL